jgi:hypothetical protein
MGLANFPRYSETGLALTWMAMSRQWSVIRKPRWHRDHPGGYGK